MCIMEDVDKYSAVANFYSGKSVFITGGTGFLGKALIEKLLYSCDGIDKIYILVREKKNVPASERITSILNSSAFARLRNEKPEVLKKIIPLVGNVGAENLGLQSHDLDCLQTKVSVVFHVAATVNFNDPLHKTVESNVAGTRRVLNLCHSMKNLQAFIHVSTAYCNSERTYIDEMVYYMNTDFKDVQRILEEYPNDENVIKNLLGKKSNVYTYSKALAEDLVLKEHGDIPTAIVRPSIVISSYNEPSPGWIDSWSGSTGVLAAVVTGLMRVLLGKPSNVCDLIPVDTVVNCIIVAATNCVSSNDLKVYNCCTGNSNPIRCRDIERICTNVSVKHSMCEIPYPFVLFINNEIIFYLLVFLLQIVPSCLIDLWSLLNGKKPRQLSIQNKVNKGREATQFFIRYQWNFADKNMRSLLTSLSKTDRAIFNFDVKTIDWEKCLEDYMLGIRNNLILRNSDKKQ